MSNDNTNEVKPPKVKKAKAKVGATVGPGGGAVGPVRASDQPRTQFNAVFGDQEAALRDWMATVHDAAGPVSGLPAGVGSFQLFTDKWQDSVTGEAVADVNGVAHVSVSADSWVEDGNSNGLPGGWNRCMGYTTPGWLIIASDGTAAYGATPALAAAIAPGIKGYSLVKPDPNINSTSRIRTLAVKLTVWTDEPFNTSKGEIVAASTVNPAADVQGGSLNNCTYADVMSSNPRTVSRYSQSLAGWAPKDTIVAIALPAEEQAFDMVQWPAVGTTTCPMFHITSIAKGMVPGAKIMWRVDVAFESEAAKSKKAIDTAAPTVRVDTSRVMNAMEKSIPYATRPGSISAGIHNLPFVEELAESNPMALAALDHHSALRPAHSAAKTQPRPLTIYQPSSGGGGILSAIKNVGGALVNSGALGAIPYVGPVIQGLAVGLKKIFGF